MPSLQPDRVLCCEVGHIQYLQVQAYVDDPSFMKVPKSTLYLATCKPLACLKVKKRFGLLCITGLGLFTLVVDLHQCNCCVLPGYIQFFIYKVFNKCYLNKFDFLQSFCIELILQIYAYLYKGFECLSTIRIASSLY